MEGLTRRLAGLAVALMPLSPAEAGAQSVALPPDTVHTVFRSDTVAGFGAVGGVTSDALGYVVRRTGTRARLELVGDGSATDVPQRTTDAR